MTLDQRRSSKMEIFEIRVQGGLDTQWSDWFDGLAILPQDNGETVLSGPIRDQAALHGVLNKIRDLGLPLLSVQQVTVSESD